MGNEILNHPDLDQEQLRRFIALCNGAVNHLFDAHRVVIEDILEEFKNNLCIRSQYNLSILVGQLDDAIASSVKLRKSLLNDLTCHHRSEKRKKHEELECKKQESENNNKK